jgi:hypothetical protein
MEIVNKWGWRMNNHIKLWAKNAFNKWRLFRGFDTMKFIVDLFQDED